MKTIRAKTFIDKEFKFPYHNRYCKVLRLCNILYHMKTKIYRKFSGKKEQGENLSIVRQISIILHHMKNAFSQISLDFIMVICVKYLQLLCQN